MHSKLLLIYSSTGLKSRGVPGGRLAKQCFPGKDGIRVGTPCTHNTLSWRGGRGSSTLEVFIGVAVTPRPAWEGKGMGRDMSYLIRVRGEWTGTLNTHPTYRKRVVRPGMTGGTGGLQTGLSKINGDGFCLIMISGWVRVWFGTSYTLCTPLAREVRSWYCLNPRSREGWGENGGFLREYSGGLDWTSSVGIWVHGTANPQQRGEDILDQQGELVNWVPIPQGWENGKNRKEERGLGLGRRFELKKCGYNEPTNQGTNQGTEMGQSYKNTYLGKCTVGILLHIQGNLSNYSIKGRIMLLDKKSQELQIKTALASETTAIGDPRKGGDSSVALGLNPSEEGATDDGFTCRSPVGHATVKDTEMEGLKHLSSPANTQVTVNDYGMFSPRKDSNDIQSIIWDSNKGHYNLSGRIHGNDSVTKEFDLNTQRDPHQLANSVWNSLVSCLESIAEKIKKSNEMIGGKTQQPLSSKIATPSKSIDIDSANRFSVLDIPNSIKLNKLIEVQDDLYLPDQSLENGDQFLPPRPSLMCQPTGQKLTTDHPDIEEKEEKDYGISNAQKMAITSRLCGPSRAVRAADMDNWDQGEHEFFEDQVKSLGLDYDYCIEDVESDDENGTAQFFAAQMKVGMPKVPLPTPTQSS
ncbi:hypothetical protein L1987_73046 [Smallanthus sonchifolius]|uniref:Uncharacterized protein n=1 Tax=Smallanthus sonchifolius TaxID=185202 RepID=A0ACB9AXR7_9ASTR|nr:hypothetical protein L1987_73046 [Smallanthus sonchifolius]